MFNNHDYITFQCNHFKTCIDKDYSLTRTFVRMLKQFLVKEVALSFTAVRKAKSSDKLQFKNTDLCKLMDGKRYFKTL